jgi:hypothetical protein
VPSLALNIVWGFSFDEGSNMAISNVYVTTSTATAPTCHNELCVI